jgi:uncharacterized phiE125 gp8 family phage protein
MIPIRIAGPAVEPVAVSELRAALRLDDETDDALLAGLLPAARARVEVLTRRTLIATTWRLVLPDWPAAACVALPVSPVLSLARLARLDPDGTLAPLDDGLAVLDPVPSDPPRLRFAAPRPALAPGALAIEVVAGYGATADAVPPPLTEAVRRLVARAYEHRGDAAPDDPAALDAEIAALVGPYRALHL